MGSLGGVPCLRASGDRFVLSTTTRTIAALALLLAACGSGSSVQRPPGVQRPRKVAAEEDAGSDFDAATALVHHEQHPDASVHFLLDAGKEPPEALEDGGPALDSVVSVDGD